MVFKDVCILVLWTKVAPALEGLNGNPSCSEFHLISVVWILSYTENKAEIGIIFEQNVQIDISSNIFQRVLSSER